MAILLYHADGVGPICRRLAQLAPSLVAVRDGESSPKGHKVIIRWGSISTRESEQVINTVQAVALAKDKAASRKALGDLAPATWFTLEDIGKLPIVYRPRVHFAGKRFYVCKTYAEASKARKLCGLGAYATELVDKKTEYRVFALQGRIVCVSQRFPPPDTPNAIPWNLALGGRLINLRQTEWPVGVLKAAIEANQRLGLDWSAIDLAVDVKGRILVFEANTAPGLRNPHTLACIAKSLAWVDSNPTPKPIKDTTRWQSFLHPALRKKE